MVEVLLACVLSPWSRSTERIARMKAHAQFLPSADIRDDLVIFDCLGYG
jgi:hypothetical protein